MMCTRYFTSNLLFASSSNKAIEYLESKNIYCLLSYYRDKHSLRLITESRLTRDIKHNHLVSYLTLAYLEYFDYGPHLLAV